MLALMAERGGGIRASVQVAVIALTALVAVGCGGSTSASAGASPGPPQTAAAPTVRPTPTAAPATPAPATPAPATPAPSSTPRDLSFTSTIYPYSIVLPAAPFEPGPIAMVPEPGTWKPATETWDGIAVISPSNPHPNDSTIDTDGDEFFAVGRPTDDDLDTFVARMVGNYATWHGCSRTPLSRPATIDGEPAVLIASECGRGGASAVATRLLVVHEGFGLIFNIRSFRAVEPELLMERISEYVAGVDLRP
jgi:hypothetical protein